MTTKTERQYGLWSSPITPRSLAEDRRLESARWDSDGRTLVWLEGRSGHGVLMAQGPGGDAPRELVPELNVRAEVGYGGGDYTVHGGYVYFAVHKTGRLWRVPTAGGPARPITPPFGKAASPEVSPDGRRLVYVHHDDDGADRIAAIDAEGRGWPQSLVTGHDFFMQPRISPDGRFLAWIAWDHPNMPWDGTVLFLASLETADDGRLILGPPKAVAGGPETAVFQPEFTPDGARLLFVSDETGWSHLSCYELASGRTRRLTQGEAEYALPAWVQGMRTYAITADGKQAIAVRNERAVQRLERIDLAAGAASPIVELSHYTEVSQIFASPAEDRVAFVGANAVTPPRIVEYDLAGGVSRIVARSSSESIRPESLAVCTPFTWKTADGEQAHGLFYAPASDRFSGVGRPPLLVLIHGGPTSQFRAGWSPQAQFFATRGYAVLLVNYRGSTGYGRQYMLRLRGNWGICDVDDAVTGAQQLAAHGKIDPDKTILMGGSAGGFTVLQTMVEQPEAFTAGICLYGVANQFHLASDTHKFEARYLDSLLGPLPQAADVYRERSPVFHAERIRRPLAVFQGENDNVVPRDQSDAIVEALKQNRTPHTYHIYEGEGHGWRKRETIEHFYRSVESFLKQYVIYT